MPSCYESPPSLDPALIPLKVSSQKERKVVLTRCLVVLCDCLPCGTITPMPKPLATALERTRSPGGVRTRRPGWTRTRRPRAEDVPLVVEVRDGGPVR